MRILVVNCGSSSLKLGVFDISGEEREVIKATYDRFSPEVSNTPSLRLELPQLTTSIRMQGHLCWPLRPANCDGTTNIATRFRRRVAIDSRTDPRH